MGEKIIIDDEEAERRMDIIGQNGNEGLHYEDESPPSPPTRKNNNKIMKKEKSTKKLQCRCKDCTNIVEVAKTSLSVVCSFCTFKMAEGILEYSK